jgi:hypothetical protein
MLRGKEPEDKKSWTYDDDLEEDLWYEKDDDEEGGASSGIPRVPISPLPPDSAIATPDW